MGNEVLETYLKKVNEQYRTGIAKEHAYRGALGELVDALLPQLLATNEPVHVACGAPDFAVCDRKSRQTVFYIEAKDIGDGDLDGRNVHREQFDRYRQGLSLVIFTDYLDFHFYRGETLVEKVQIAEEAGGRIRPVAENFERLLALLADFAAATPEKIKSPSRLAALMAAKARMLAFSAEKALKGAADVQLGYLPPIRSLYDQFRQVLIADTDEHEFADIFAQTVTYGLFAARLHDPTPEDFSREEAERLVPASNPFLKHLFHQIAEDTHNDNLNISFTDREQRLKIDDLISLGEGEWRTRTGRLKDSRDWTYATAREDALANRDSFTTIAYRPLDIRHTCYTGNSRGLYSSPQPNVMRQFIGHENVVFCALRLNSRGDDLPVLVTDKITDKTILSSKDNANVFPLWLYAKDELNGEVTRKANFDETIYAKICAAGTTAKTPSLRTPAEIRAFLEGEPVARLTGHEFEGVNGIKALKQAIYDSYESVQWRSCRSDIGTVQLSRSGINDSLCHGFGRMKVAAFAALPQLIARGMAVRRSENWKGRGYDSVVLVAPVEIGAVAHDRSVLSRTPDSMRSLSFSLWAVNGDSTGTAVTAADAQERIPPERVFDYIYAVLHDVGYREKYREFLKVDFPRIPYSTAPVSFERLATLGSELRELHLMKRHAPQRGDRTFSRHRFCSRRDATDHG